MPIDLVHDFELVQIDHRDEHRGVAAVSQRLGQYLGYLFALQKSGDHVVADAKRQLLLGGLGLGDVHQLLQHQSVAGVRGILGRHDAHVRPHHPAILASVLAPPGGGRGVG